MAGFNLGALVEAATSGGNADLIQSMARRAGLSESDINSAIRALTPALAAGLNREEDNGNAGELVATVANAGTSRDLSDLGDPVETGNALLGRLFGSRDVSRAVAADASNRTGISEDALKALLPVLASALVSGLAQNNRQQPEQSSGLLGGLMGSLGGQSGLASLAGQFLGGRGEPDEQPGLTDDIMRMILRR